MVPMSTKVATPTISANAAFTLMPLCSSCVKRFLISSMMTGFVDVAAEQLWVWGLLGKKACRRWAAQRGTEGIAGTQRQC